MEMVETKLIPLLLAVMLSASCSYSFSWKSYDMDGSRTGVTAATADNAVEALGSVGDGVYHAPNGKSFTEGTVIDVAEDLISVQHEMMDLKEVIGHASMDMKKHAPESELSNWAVDHIMQDTERLTGRKVDFGIMNFGGIRTSLSAGDILRDDIVSMFPFRNSLCYVQLKGSDVQAIFDDMAARRVQVLGGVKLVVKDKKVETLEIGGKPLDPDRLYGLATIDFLLDGGDGLTLAKNAKELIITDVLVMDSMLPYVLETTAAGKDVEYFTDGRVEIR